MAEHAREMVITRLGKGVDRTGRFDPAALARTLEVLAGYAETCRRLGVERRRLVATSATRDAADRQAFLDGVRDLLGVEAEVLTGQAEAAAAYRGATAGLEGDQPTLVVDIGGGSTELILGDGAAAGPWSRWTSAACGCSSATCTATRRPPTRWPRSGPTSPATCRGSPRCSTRRPRSGSSGSRARSPPSPRSPSGSTPTTRAASTSQALDPAEIGAVAGKLAAMTVAERAAMPVMAKGREDVIVAGALLLDELVRRFRLRQVIASETDILDGVLLGLAERPR